MVKDHVQMDDQRRPAAARRVLALTRDERAVREAVIGAGTDADFTRRPSAWPGLAEADVRAFDSQTIAEVTLRATHLAETMTAILDDDDLWKSLAGAAGPLKEPTLELIRELHTPALTDLLVFAGYRTPPPPPIDELVGPALRSLDRAMLLNYQQYDAQFAVNDARFMFGTMVLRTRRQFDLAAGQSEDDAGAAAERLAASARRMIPILAGVAAGALIELHMPGTGAGFVAGSAGQKAAELGVEWAAQMLIGLVDTDGTPSGHQDRWETIGDNAVLAHGVMLNELLDRLTSDSLPVTDRITTVREAQLHLARLIHLASDYGISDDVRGTAETLHTLVDGIASLTLASPTEALHRLSQWASDEGRHFQSLLLEHVDQQAGPFA